MSGFSDQPTRANAPQRNPATRDWGAASGRGDEPLRRVLVIAYYFPPMGMSGVQRTAKFVKYLQRIGWQPTVLTCQPGGYFAFDPSLLDEIEAAGIEVIRARGWDPTRLFRSKSVVPLPREDRRLWFSRISQFMFVPDNKIGWYRAARQAGLDAVERLQPDVIFSTAPPYTAHLVGRSLSRRTGTPLVLDFRDDWVGNPRHLYPTALHLRASAILERKALESADRVIVINDYIRRNLLRRNAGVISPDHVSVLEQGFDPEDFEEPVREEARPSRFRILYSGVFYDVQTPDNFLLALADLLTRRMELRERIEAVFVGILPDSAAAIIEQVSLGTVVKHTGYLPHSEVIGHLRTADVLWMTVGRCEGSETISTSKLFEYFGTRKPVLGLVPAGAAREALEQYEASEIARPDSVAEISSAIERLFDAWEQGVLPQPDPSAVERYDRRNLTQRLGSLFDNVVAERRQTMQPAGPIFDADALSS